MNTERSVDKARVLPQTLTPYESILPNKERCSHEIKEDQDFEPVHLVILVIKKGHIYEHLLLAVVRDYKKSKNS